ncbi:hypothetical protein [Citricoccus nitrophenolicus]|uniref:hypothetical protein n=1 Tax=Citricoccus nitrophenolicus TaxID=863575 RepID=UPI0031E76B04
MAEHEGGARRTVPPTAVRLLPVLIVVFGLSMLIDSTTDWPVWVRWILSIGGGMVAQYIVVKVWAARQR